MKKLFLFLFIYGLLVSSLIAARPVISGLTKVSGPAKGGSYIGVIGQNFNKSTYFLFGSKRVITKRFIDETLVYVMTVEDSVGSVGVRAYSPGQRSSAMYNDYSFTNNPPILERTNINNGPSDGNTIVHYYGENLSPNVTINFGNAESIRRRFYHSDRMYSYTPAIDLETANEKVVDISIEAENGSKAILTEGFTFQKNAPVISRVWPSSGIKQGGTLLRVWGRNFRATDRWYIGEKEVQFYYPNKNKIIKYGNSGFIYLKTEAAEELAIAEAMVVKVVPANKDIGSGSKTDAFTYTTAAPEFVTVYPNKGFASGSTLYIRGKNISNDAVLNFLKLDDDEDATTDNQATITRYYHDGIIRVKTAARSEIPSTGELVDIIMENDNGIAKNLGGFMYWDLAPRIHYVYPNNGVVTGNQYVYIRGRNFKANGTDVSFSTQESPDVRRVYNSGFMVIKTKPASIDGAVAVTLSSAEGEATLDGGYVYTKKSPFITSIWPLADTKNGNRNLYLYGENFTPDTKISFEGGAAIDIDYFYNSRRIRVKTPEHAVGKVDITVETEFGNPYTAIKTYRFYDALVIYPEGTPLVNYISPLAGIQAGGSYVHLYGKNLTKDTKVLFDGKPANIRRVHPSGRRITILTPSVDYSKSVDITTSRNVGDSDLEYTLETAFQYTADKPVIKMIYPAKGFIYGGTYVTLYGNNFTKDMSLKLGNQTAILHRFYHSGAARFLTAPNLQPESVDINVMSQFGMESLSNAFHYAKFSPQVRAITPNHGKMSGGNRIRIYGSFFTPDTKVLIDGILVAEDQIRYYHTRYITFKAPLNLTTHHKTVNIEIKTPFGSVLESNSYTYVHPDVKLSEQK